MHTFGIMGMVRISRDKIVDQPLLITLWFLTGLLFSCNEKTAEKNVERSFYYWKSVVKLTAFERQLLDTLQVKTIYLKFFDVDWDASQAQPIPQAKVLLPGKPVFLKYQIIPTVFIANACFQKIDSAQTVLLAGKIDGLIKNICATNQLGHIAEIQVDCDWTITTRKNYFDLLKTLRQLGNHTISATIRLHQIKFLSKMGIPPVNRGLLMCYNMGNLKNPATRNSIIETAEFQKYISRLSTYPLPLDIGLPLFEWKVWFRDNIYKGLIANLPTSTFTNSFTLKTAESIEILKDSLLEGYAFKKGDLLRSEESDIKTLLAVSKEINKRLKNREARVSLYHLDSLTLRKFTQHELESIYGIFR